MSTVRLQGCCLNGEESLVEIRLSEGFALYLHVDSQPPVSIDYSIDSIRVRDHTVTVGDLQHLHVVEHLFSALYGFDLFNVRIDVHGSEIPFFDGSSREIGLAMADFDGDESPVIIPDGCIEISEGESVIRYTPGADGGLIVDMMLVHPYIGMQRITLPVTRQTYASEIMPARTFVFTHEEDPRLHDLPPYGIGITEKKIHSAAPLRFEDEPVRHKILDLLGDLYVMRGRLCGKIVAINTSHRLNFQFIRKVISSMDGLNA
ncbi:MAG: UDP-3-O-acyl-N-acetylglucosamine deacetylase [candidate division WOR-3 bacterium]|nr:MAG: UDP-3-O-acyl-N-acetylglucosamine deacetylase [candidate division WOR-3 bacterium]